MCEGEWRRDAEHESILCISARSNNSHCREQGNIVNGLSHDRVPDYLGMAGILLAKSACAAATQIILLTPWSLSLSPRLSALHE